MLQVPPGGGDGRVAVALRRRYLGQRHHADHPGQSLTLADNQQALRLPSAPVFRQAGGFLSLMLSHHLPHPRPVALPGTVDESAGASLPFEKRPHQGILAVQVDVVQQNTLLLVAARLLQTGRVIGARAAM